MFSLINRTIKRTLLRIEKAKPIIRISDTTLRDGLQTPGIRLTTQQRVTVAKALAGAGIHSIDCGFPAANPLDYEACKEIAAKVQGPILSVHSRTKAEDIEKSAEVVAKVSPFRKAIGLFIGVSPIHRQQKHNMTRAQIVDTIVKSIDKASKHFEMISFGPEDASRTEPEFLAECFKEAIGAGAMSVGFADTVGILTPDKVTYYIKYIQDHVSNIDDAMIGVHFHNDLGCATANSLAAVKAGANMVQGTINGIGERAGNAAIEEIVVALSLHKEEFKKNVSVNVKALHGLSQLVAEFTGFPLAPNKAVVGKNLFRTETGVHQDGLLKHIDTYMPFRPEYIGAPPIEVMLGLNSGRSAVRHRLEAAGLDVTEEHVETVMKYLKNESIADSDLPEVKGFLEKMKPFIAQDEYGNDGRDVAQSVMVGDEAPHPVAKAS
ncbi:MAG: pyruvate carboxyltransferase [Phycisphaerales bacterium]|nr:pyruvate carboxyltransferase [Phycisphaerales bacterium]